MGDAPRDGVPFKVGEALIEDVGKGLARLDGDDLKRLHATPGDMLMVSGRRAAVARASQAPPSHCEQLLILMDGITRENAQAGVDEFVAARKVPFKTAESILLAPAADEHVPSDEEARHLRQLLLGLPVLLGDRLQVTFLGSRPRSFTVEGAAPRGAQPYRGRAVSPARKSGAARGPPRKAYRIHHAHHAPHRRGSAAGISGRVRVNSFFTTKPPIYRLPVTHSRHPLRPLFRSLARWACRVLLRLTVSGVENVPPTGGALLTMNHLGDVDPLMLVGCTPRDVEVIGKAEILSWPLLGALAAAYGMMAVRRGQPDRAACRRQGNHRPAQCEGLPEKAQCRG